MQSDLITKKKTEKLPVGKVTEMGKSISVTDLQLIPELSHLRMLDFVNPVNDKLIAPFLHRFGLDLDYSIVYIPCSHRNLQGKVVIGYLIAGEVRCDHEFLSSPFASAEDRIIAAGYRDLSLAEDMAASLSAVRDYQTTNGIALPRDQCNKDEKDILDQIKVLEDLLLLARGNPFKSDGSRKLMFEDEAKEEKKRRKRIKPSIAKEED